MKYWKIDLSNKTKIFKIEEIHKIAWNGRKLK